MLNRLATASFQLLRARHNFTPAAITACQKHIQQAARVATPENKQRLSTYLAEVLWYKGEANTSKALLEEYIAQHPQDIEAGFNISFVYRTLGEWENYYRANELGITCNRRLQYNGNVPQWNLERPKDDVVLVMPEQAWGMKSSISTIWQWCWRMPKSVCCLRSASGSHPFPRVSGSGDGAGETGSWPGH